MKRVTNVNKYIDYTKKNPKANTKEIAKALGTTIYQVHQIVYYLKNRDKILNQTSTYYHKNKDKIVKKTSTKREAVDNVNHPSHYVVGGIETIDFIEAKKLNYNLGNVIKYITRADHKGSRNEDLKKALWYLNRELGRNT